VNAAATTTGAAQDIDAEGVLMQGCKSPVFVSCGPSSSSPSTVTSAQVAEASSPSGARRHAGRRLHGSSSGAPSGAAPGTPGGAPGPFAVSVKVTPFFGVYWYRPSSRRRRRDSDTGPRAPCPRAAKTRHRPRPAGEVVTVAARAPGAVAGPPAAQPRTRRKGHGASRSSKSFCAPRSTRTRMPSTKGGVRRGQLHQLARRRPQRLCHQPVKMRRDLKARPEPLREDDRPTSEGARHSQPPGDGPLPPPHRPHQSQLEAFEEFGPLHHQEAQLEGQTQRPLPVPHPGQ